MREAIWIIYCYLDPTQANHVLKHNIRTNIMYGHNISPVMHHYLVGEKQCRPTPYIEKMEHQQFINHEDDSVSFIAAAKLNSD